MQEGIEGLEALGSKEDFLYLVQVILGAKQLSADDITRMLRHSSKYSNVNIRQMIAFFRKVGVLEGENVVRLSGEILGAIDNSGLVTAYAIDMIINQLFEQKALNDTQFTFNDRLGVYIFDNNLLQLKWAAVRNLLVCLDFFRTSREYGYTRFAVNPEFDNLLRKYCKTQKRTTSIEELRRRLEEAAEVGEISEQFVLEFEKRRLEGTGLTDRVKQISSVDVGAGYDIVSFDGKDSVSYDRFIEVKTTSSKGISFFWTRNEIEISRIKESRYYLYLVDINRIEEGDYSPLIICNPSETIELSDEWKMDPQSYLVTMTLRD